MDRVVFSKMMLQGMLLLKTLLQMEQQKIFQLRRPLLSLQPKLMQQNLLQKKLVTH